MFKINWQKEWNMLYILQDRRTKDIFPYRDNPYANLQPLFLVEQGTLGL